MLEILKKIGQFFLDLIETIVMALAIFVVCYLFLFQPHQVKGNSMYPNFYDGEYILTDKVSYRFGNPKRGDVVIFRSPQNKEVDYIKRIIGLPGERIEIKGGQVYINGEKLDESYLPAGTVTLPDMIRKIGPEDYFLMGDNRPDSSDSRIWGVCPKRDLIGKAAFIIWPFQFFGKAEKQMTKSETRNPNK